MADPLSLTEIVLSRGGIVGNSQQIYVTTRVAGGSGTYQYHIDFGNGQTHDSVATPATSYTAVTLFADGTYTITVTVTSGAESVNGIRILTVDISKYYYYLNPEQHHEEEEEEEAILQNWYEDARVMWFVAGVGITALVAAIIIVAKK